MNIDNLVRMANQIGTFFESATDREQSLEDIATHLLRFWDPRMRRQLVEHVENTPDSGLTAIVHKSITTNRPRLI
jgi:formate dehydrogenase subunit delta